MPLPPPGQEPAQRLADRRHTDRQSDFADDPISVSIPSMTDGIKFGQGSADVPQHRVAASRQPNPRVPTFE
jgi:hypothetical protein